MKSVPLTVFPRVAAKRTRVKKLRTTGRIPAVIYGRRRQAQNLELKLKDLEDLVHHSASENILVDLTVDGEGSGPRLALVQEVQHHALSGKALHVDFHEVAADERVVITVPVETVGESEGVKTGGGVLEHVLFKLKVRALPKDLPDAITVDVTHLLVGQAVHIGEIQPPPNVEILGDKHISVIAVSEPVAEVVEATPEAVAEAALAEPEVIKEKKEEAGAEGEKGEKAEKGAKPEKGGEKAPEKAPEKAAEKKAEKKK